MESLTDFIGKNDFTWFWGVVEDTADPLTLGRVRVRCFGIHPWDRQDVPTIDLPWAIVMQPTTSASVSGLGWSPNGLEQGSWVLGFFTDGKTAQYPLVVGTIPNIHRPNAPGDPGASYSGYLNDSAVESGEGGGNQFPYHGGNPESAVNSYNPNNPNRTGGPRASIKDDGSYLSKADIDKWPLEIYTWTPSRNDNGLACKDSDNSLWVHYATCLALENLTKDLGISQFSITSAYRTRAYNESLRSRGINAARNSQHIYGRAFDIQKSSIPNQTKFLQQAVKNGFVGFGIYSSFIHIDTGTGRVWNGATSKEVVKTLKEAGWYSGKPGLSGIRTSPGVSNTNIESVSDLVAAQADKENGGNLKNLTNPNAIYIRDDLTESGYTTEGIAAVLGAMLNESTFNPNATTIDTNNKRSSGLSQWNGPRDSRMRNYTEKNGFAWNAIEGQMDYFVWEQKTHYTSIHKTLTSSTSLQECFQAMNRFEAYQGYNDPNHSQYIKRWNDTKAFYDGDPGPGSYMGGFNDPTNSLPFREYRGQPSTHYAARGFNSDAMHKVGSYVDNLSNMPIAGDKGTFGSPENSYSGQYPYNKTFATRSGHLLEFDDTPNAERVNIHHKSGTRITMTAKGTMIEDVKGKKYTVVHNDEYHAVLGNLYLTARDDINIRSTSDMTQHADGSWQIIIGNDRTEFVAGKHDMNIGETHQFKAKKVIIEAEQIDMYSKGDFNLQAEEAFNIKSKSFNVETTEGIGLKAGKALKMSATEDMSLGTSKIMRIKGGTDVNVEAGAKMNIKSVQKIKVKSDEKLEFKSPAYQLDTDSPPQTKTPWILGGIADDPDSAAPEAPRVVEDAQSTDLGKAPARTSIERKNEAKEDPDSHNTSDDGLEQYGKKSI